MIVTYQVKSIGIGISDTAQYRPPLSVPTLTRPVHEVALRQAGDLQPLQEEDGGRDVGLQDQRPVLCRQPLVFWVQAETLAWIKKKHTTTMHNSVDDVENKNPADQVGGGTYRLVGPAACAALPGTD